MRLDLLALVLAKRRALRGRERWPSERIAAHQRAKVDELLQFAAARSPYYRALLPQRRADNTAGSRGAPETALAAIPPLTKATLMSRFDEIATDPRVRLADVERFLADGGGRFAGRYWVAATSGSSGRRAIMPENLREWTATIASYARAQEWAGVQPRLTSRSRMAVVSSTSLSHQSALVGAAVKSPFLVTERYDAGAPLAETVAALNRFQPELLVAYASMLAILADEQHAGRLAITPRAVNASSEPLTVEMRARVRDAWGVECFDVYAATEASGIAAECHAHRGLHVFDDLVILEIVDDAGRPVAAGEAGTQALVTVLASRTLPIIRYQLTDRIRTLPEDQAAVPCPCGRTFRRIAGVEGRTDDVLRLPREDGGTALVHPVVFHRVLEATPVAGWQVRQRAGALEVLLAQPAIGVDADQLAAAIAAAVERTGARRPTVRAITVEAIPAGAAGKRPRIVADPTATGAAP